MPRLDHKPDVATVLTAREVLLVDLLLAELNALRAHLGLPERTAQDMRQGVREHLKTQAATRRAQRGT